MFNWTPGRSGKKKFDLEKCPIFIRFEHEDWKPVLMKPVKIPKKIKKLPQNNPITHGKTVMLSRKEIYLRKHKSGTKVEKEEFTTVWQVRRMVPPGRIKFIFTSPKKICVARDRIFNTEKTRSKNTGNISLLSSAKLANYPKVKLHGRKFPSFIQNNHFRGARPNEPRLFG